MKSSFLIFIVIASFSCGKAQTKSVDSPVSRIEMKLSAFGVEADDFPSIDIIIDLKNDSSRCVASFYNPAYKGYTYILTKEQMNSIVKLLDGVDLGTLKKEFTTNRSDQPRATTTIYTKENTYKFNDYGLEADVPLKDLYKIAFRYK